METGVKKCPGCRDGVMTSTLGRLDQCEDTYLPAVIWFCPRCMREESVPDLTPDDNGRTWRAYDFTKSKGKP